MQISHESIYQWIYTQKDLSLALNLFTKRKKRQNRSNIYKNRGIPVEKKISENDLLKQIIKLKSGIWRVILSSVPVMMRLYLPLQIEKL